MQYKGWKIRWLSLVEHKTKIRGSLEQYEQTAGLFFQYLAIYNKKNLPKNC